MIIFKDIFSGDELGSDSFPKEVEDEVVYKLTTKLITRTEDAYNLAPDALGEQYDASAVTVNNLIDAHRLVETPFDKKSYMTHIKSYMGKLKKHLEANHPDRVKPFMTGAQAFVKKVIAEIDQYQFFTGEKMDSDAMVALMRYSEDGQTPYIYIWKDGIKEEKY